MSNDQGPGEQHVSAYGIAALAVAMTLVGLAILYSLWAFWPASGKAATDPQRIAWFGWHVRMSRDFLFFLTAALAGTLGGLTHSLRSLAWYVGNRKLRYSWMLFHLMLPLVGALTSTVFYLVLRAGLFSPSTSSQSVSPYGFAAVGVLAGLFSEQALGKLRDIATELFSERPKGSDPADE